MLGKMGTIMNNMKRSLTYRGFRLLEFIDYYQQECSLQESSIYDIDCVWLGIDNTGPEIKGQKGEYNECVPNRMHLSKEQIVILIDELQYFVTHGRLK